MAAMRLLLTLAGVMRDSGRVVARLPHLTGHQAQADPHAFNSPFNTIQFIYSHLVERMGDAWPGNPSAECTHHPLKLGWLGAAPGPTRSIGHPPVCADELWGVCVVVNYFYLIIHYTQHLVTHLYTRMSCRGARRGTLLLSNY